MHFAFPAALWLLLLLPLLLLRTRRPQRRIAVGTLRFWDRLETPRVAGAPRRLTIDRLLVVQALFIATLALALARPTIALATGEVALIVDVSIGMGARGGDGRTRLHVATTEASDLLERLPSNTRVHLYLAAAQTVDRGTFSATDRGLRRALQGLSANDATGDLETAVVAARGSRPSAIYVFSDAPSRDRTPSDIIWRTIGAAADNAAVTALTVERLPSGELQLLVAMRNYGRHDIDGEVTLSRGDAVLTRRTIHIAAAATATTVATIDGATGVISARLSPDDALPADNVRRAIATQGRPISVALSGGGFFVERALGVLPGVRIVRTAERTAPASAAAPDVVVCESCEIPEGFGAGLLVLSGTRDTGNEPQPLSIVAAGHPLLRGVHLAGQTATMTSATLRAGTPANAVVIANAGATPVILASEVNGRRVVELRADLDASTLPLDPAFPIFIANTVHWLAGDVMPSTLVAGAPLDFAASAGDEISISGPGGLTIPHQIVNGRLVATDTATAGVYQVRQSDRDILIAVNPALDDSALATTAARQVAAPSASASRPGLDRVRQPVALLILAASLALLAGEWHLTRTRAT